MSIEGVIAHSPVDIVKALTGGSQGLSSGFPKQMSVMFGTAAAAVKSFLPGSGGMGAAVGRMLSGGTGSGGADASHDLKSFTERSKESAHGHTADSASGSGGGHQSLLDKIGHAAKNFVEQPFKDLGQAGKDLMHGDIKGALEKGAEGALGVASFAAPELKLGSLGLEAAELGGKALAEGGAKSLAKGAAETGLQSAAKGGAEDAAKSGVGSFLDAFQKVQDIMNDISTAQSVASTVFGNNNGNASS